jgi:Nodulation protein S (NodS)
MAISADYFEALFAGSDDPWSFRSRWYEARKRALTLASLPRQKYATAYEPGCANGELSAELAVRCERLLISDGTPRAVDLARERVKALPHVEVVQAWVPDEWPSRTFDLIVISELGYFLTEESLGELMAKARQSLLLNGTVLACHWRRPIQGCVMTGDDVHARLHQSLGLARMVSTTDTDFLLDVWCSDRESVAQKEQIP